MEPKIHYKKKDVEELVSPFVHLTPPWDVYEVLKTIITSVILLPIRVLIFILLLFLIWISSKLVLFGVPKGKREEVAFQNLTRFQSVMALFIRKLNRAMLFLCFGIVKIKYSPKKLTNSKYTIIANHTGYLDIMVLMYTYNASFISKGALEFYPIVGVTASALQCLFIRQNDNVVEKLTKRMKLRYDKYTERNSSGCIKNLIVFPEGTTTNGSSIIAFRSGVFSSGLPLQPVCVTFPHKHWNPSWETVDFRRNLFRSMTQFVNHVSIVELPVYTPNEEEKNDSRLYASNVQRIFSEALKVPLYKLNRKHKMVYHDYYFYKSIDENEVFSRCEEISKNDAQLQYLSEIDKSNP